MQRNSTYPKEIRRQKLAVLLFRLVLLPCAGCCWLSICDAAGNVQPNSYAWSENAGWLNFAPTAGPGVTVNNTSVSGFAWSENFGWINLFPTGAGVVNRNGVLSGFAWGENAGWINFAPAVGGVSIDGTGRFNGWAWGENIGWINFATQSPVVTTWIASDLIFANGFD